jgi:hypothetical protein
MGKTSPEILYIFRKVFLQTNYNPIAAHSAHQMLALVFFHRLTPTRCAAGPRVPPASRAPTVATAPAPSRAMAATGHGDPHHGLRHPPTAPRAPTVATASAPSRAMAATGHGDPRHGLHRPPRPHVCTVVAGRRTVSRPPPVEKVKQVLQHFKK